MNVNRNLSKNNKIIAINGMDVKGIIIKEDNINDVSNAVKLWYNSIKR